MLNLNNMCFPYLARKVGSGLGAILLILLLSYYNSQYSRRCWWCGSNKSKHNTIHIIINRWYPPARKTGKTVPSWRITRNTNLLTARTRARGDFENFWRILASASCLPKATNIGQYCSFAYNTECWTLCFAWWEQAANVLCPNGGFGLAKFWFVSSEGLLLLAKPWRIDRWG